MTRKEPWAIERAAARLKGEITFSTGRPCKHGHPAVRYVSNGICVLCAAALSKTYAAENRDKYREYDARRCIRDADKIAARQREFYIRNKGKYASKYKTYVAGIAGFHAARSASRKAQRLQATPPWANLKAISAIYAERARISVETGEEWHVDHIVPLRHPLICGLHVESSLRIVPKQINMSKHNKLIFGLIPPTPGQSLVSGYVPGELRISQPSIVQLEVKQCV